MTFTPKDTGKDKLLQLADFTNGKNLTIKYTNIQRIFSIITLSSNSHFCSGKTYVYTNHIAKCCKMTNFVLICTTV